MQATGNELSFLLDRVSPEQIGASSRQRALLSSEDRYLPAILFSCETSWSTRPTTSKTTHSGPQHQTLRHRGLAPAFPRPIDLTRGAPGKLILYRDRLTLEPSDEQASVTVIKAADIRRVSFYADCIEVIHGKSEQTLLCTDAIEQLDLKFEVYYGRKCGTGFN